MDIARLEAITNIMKKYIDGLSEPDNENQIAFLRAAQFLKGIQQDG